MMECMYVQHLHTVYSMFLSTYILFVCEGLCVWCECETERIPVSEAVV